MSVAKSKRQIIAAARLTAGLLQEASAATDQLLTALSTDLKAPIETDAKAAHRREHRMGVPSKLATDSEVWAS